MGDPIIVNGKTIPISDIDRIRISSSNEPSSSIIGRLKAEERNSSVFIIGGLSYAWQAADAAKDVTDDFIKGAPGNKKSDAQSKATLALSNQRVFIVHGHDNALKTDLENFCRTIGLDPIVLHRQADRGLTVIEKFEKHSEVQYAFILLTPDDVAYSAAEEQKDEKDRSKELRARQNVIFEFGYFAAKLTRAKVCCIYKSGVKLPSDLNGLIYKEVRDSIEEIGYAIIKELQAAGMKVKIA
jgi:predicted nucleotide-binding protein